MRKQIVAGNWKMNNDYNEGVSLFSEIVNMVRDEKKGNQIAVDYGTHQIAPKDN